MLACQIPPDRRNTESFRPVSDLSSPTHIQNLSPFLDLLPHSNPANDSQRNQLAFQMDMSSSTPQAYTNSNPAIRAQQQQQHSQAMPRLVTGNSMPLHQAWGTINQEGSSKNSNIPRPQSAVVPSRRARGFHRRGLSSSAVNSHPSVNYSHYQMSAALHPSLVREQSSLHSGTSGRRNDSVHDYESARFSKHLPTPNDTPNPDSFYASSMPPTFYSARSQSHPDSILATHMATTKQALMEQNGAFEEEAPAFTPGVHSVSSYSQSPATPRTVYGDDFADDKFKVANNNEFIRHTFPKLDRTMSDVYQDELFNPMNTPVQPPVSKPTTNPSLLSPYRNSVTERLSAANEARSQSRPSSTSSAVSPFRPSSPLAPKNDDFETNPIIMGNVQSHQQRGFAAQARALRQQEEDLEPKTISPKDAVLDYQEEPGSTDESKVSLFPDNSSAADTSFANGADYGDVVAARYRDATGGNINDTGYSQQPWHDVADVSTSSPTFSYTETSSPQTNFDFVPQHMPSVTAPKFPFSSSQHYRSAAGASASGSAHEPTPEFPADLRSMESSASDASAMSGGGGGTMDATSVNFDSSQGSGSGNGSIMDLSKPASTRADRGTYTCTYHGCTNRFETPQELQKHKRECHRHNNHHHHQHNLSSGSIGYDPSGLTTIAPSSPLTSKNNYTTTSPSSATSSSAMPFLNLSNRNTQAGPHRCDRINPSTGKPCNTIFSRPYDLTRHEDTIHNARKQKVRCEYCKEEKTFSRSDALTRHMRVVHPNVDFPGRYRKRGEKGTS